MMEEAADDGFTDFVPVLASADDVELVTIHDLQDLLAHVLSSTEGASVQEVFVAPGVTELVSLPGLIDIEQHQVISFRAVELGLLLVCLRSLVLGAVEERLHREHGDNGQDLLGAGEVDGCEEDLEVTRVSRKREDKH